MRPRPRRAAPHRSPLLRLLLPAPPPPHPLRRQVPLLLPPPPPRPAAAAASSPSRPAPPRPAPAAVPRQRGREMPGMPGAACRRHGGVGTGSGAARCGLRRERLRGTRLPSGPGLPCSAPPRGADVAGRSRGAPGRGARRRLRYPAQPVPCRTVPWRPGGRGRHPTPHRFAWCTRLCCALGKHRGESPPNRRFLNTLPYHTRGSPPEGQKDDYESGASLMRRDCRNWASSVWRRLGGESQQCV